MLASNIQWKPKLNYKIPQSQNILSLQLESPSQERSEFILTCRSQSRMWCLDIMSKMNSELSLARLAARSFPRAFRRLRRKRALWNKHAQMWQTERGPTMCLPWWLFLSRFWAQNHSTSSYFAIALSWYGTHVHISNDHLQLRVIYTFFSHHMVEELSHVLFVFH